ncbi:hypothetical protein G6F38_012033 [Rhizopus arrhizus]|nr:hypothetical protein G6F38_012033 [Rhizopus arrhizus]
MVDCGLISRLIESDGFRDKVLAIADQAAQFSVSAVRTTKRLIRGIDVELLEKVNREEMHALGERMESAESIESIRQFIEAGKKKKAKFLVASSLAIVSAQSATASEAPTRTSNSACAVQSVFDLCIQNQDDYIKRCGNQDFACLCSTNKQKLSCWNNCPNDTGLLSQQGAVENYCSMPGANVSVTPWSSSALPTSTATNIVANNSSSASSTTAPSTTHATSGASTISAGALGTAVMMTVLYFI